MPVIGLAESVPTEKAAVSIYSICDTGNKKISLSWEEFVFSEPKPYGGTYSEGYEIYRSVNDASHFKKYKNEILDGFEDINVNYGHTYYYKVRAYRNYQSEDGSTSVQYSQFSKVVSALVAPTLEAPNLKTWVTGSRKIQLSWKRNSDASGYQIYRSTKKKGTYKKIKTITNNRTVKFTNRKLKKKKKYYYKIRAYKIANGKTFYGAFSSRKSAKTSPNVGRVETLFDGEGYDDYGWMELYGGKVYYSKKKLVYKTRVYNNRIFRAQKFKKIRIEITGYNGKVIAKQTFRNVKLNMKPFGDKSITFRFSKKGTKQKNVNLRQNGRDRFFYSIECDYWDDTVWND